MTLNSLALGLAAAITLALTPLAGSAPAPTPTPYCAISVDHPNSAVCATTPEQLATAWARSDLSTASTVLMAVLYDNANMDTSAGDLEIFGAAACTSTTSDIDHTVSNLGSFNKRTTSFQSYNNCATRLWSGTSYTGTAFPTSTGYLVSTTNVGTAFNDKAQSAQFS